MAMVDAIGPGAIGYYHVGAAGTPTASSSGSRYSHAHQHQMNALRREFRRLADQWLDDIQNVSSITEMVCHEAHLQIIAMGKPVLPLIFSELERMPNHWFIALRAITGNDPVSPDQEGDLYAMRSAWLEWAQQEGYA